MAIYELNGSANDLISAAEKLWDDPTVRREAETKGIDTRQLPTKFSEAITVTRRGAGLEPGTTALLIAFAPAVIQLTKDFSPLIAQIIRDYWTKLLLPRLEQKIGLKEKSE